MMRAALLVGLVVSLLWAQPLPAAEKQDWFPAGSSWTGVGYLKDAKGQERDRGRFVLIVTSRDEGRFTGTLGKTEGGGGDGAGRVEVVGVITASNRVTFDVTKVVEGQPPQEFIGAQFAGRVVDDGQRLPLSAVSPKGTAIEMDLTRDSGEKKE